MSTALLLNGGKSKPEFVKLQTKDSLIARANWQMSDSVASTAAMDKLDSQVPPSSVVETSNSAGKPIEKPSELAKVIVPPAPIDQPVIPASPPKNADTVPVPHAAPVDVIPETTALPLPRPPTSPTHSSKPASPIAQPAVIDKSAVDPAPLPSQPLAIRKVESVLLPPAPEAPAPPAVPIDSKLQLQSTVPMQDSEPATAPASKVPSATEPDFVMVFEAEAKPTPPAATSAAVKPNSSQVMPPEPVIVPIAAVVKTTDSSPPAATLPHGAFISSPPKPVLPPRAAAPKQPAAIAIADSVGVCGNRMDDSPAIVPNTVPQIDESACRVGRIESVANQEFPNGLYTGQVKIIRDGAGGKTAAVRHGQGILKYVNGNEYSGDWADDRANGKGKFVWKQTKSSYDGDWVADKKDGIGEYSYGGSEEKYRGGWANDKKNGRGTYYYKSGSRYEGQFVNGVAEGEGEYFFHTKDRYKGNWKDDKPHGKGTYEFADGSKYVGDFVNDKKHGFGVYSTKEGITHTGNWVDGGKEGTFQCHDPTKDRSWIEEWAGGQGFVKQQKDSAAAGDGLNPMARIGMAAAGTSTRN